MGVSRGTARADDGVGEKKAPRQPRRPPQRTPPISMSAESTLLANKDDLHAIKVFDTSIKGETDRFAYRFVKR